MVKDKSFQLKHLKNMTPLSFQPTQTRPADRDTCGCTSPHGASGVFPGKGDLLRCRPSCCLVPVGTLVPTVPCYGSQLFHPISLLPAWAKHLAQFPLRLGAMIWGLYPQWDRVGNAIPSTRISCLKLDGAENFLHAVPKALFCWKLPVVICPLADCPVSVISQQIKLGFHNCLLVVISYQN